MTDEEIHFIIDAIETTVTHIREWEQDYCYDPHSNEYYHQAGNTREGQRILHWFDTRYWENG